MHPKSFSKEDLTFSSYIQKDLLSWNKKSWETLSRCSRGNIKNWSWSRYPPGVRRSVHTEVCSLGFMLLWWLWSQLMCCTKWYMKLIYYWDHKISRNVFIEVINQARSNFIVHFSSHSFYKQRCSTLLAVKKGAGLVFLIYQFFLKKNWCSSSKFGLLALWLICLKSFSELIGSVSVLHLSQIVIQCQMMCLNVSIKTNVMKVGHLDRTLYRLEKPYAQRKYCILLYFSCIIPLL